ncbi:MAG: signal peptidase II [Candidatus Tokpelaia sp. JSC161]|jgi:signal peptidase II|nr:MAG: signal peptidase II [Candidatus Tokpelaia sp. JSC161]
MKYRDTFFTPALLSLIVTLDQLVKYSIINNLKLGERLDLLPFLALYHTRNPGIAFSMLSSFKSISLLILTSSVLLFIVYLASIQRLRILPKSGYFLIIGGSLGNLIDRLRFHYVIDYIFLHLGKWSFAIFNVADLCISVGTLCIIIDEMHNYLRKKKQYKSANNLFHKRHQHSNEHPIQSIPSISDED